MTSSYRCLTVWTLWHNSSYTLRHEILFSSGKSSIIIRILIELQSYMNIISPKIVNQIYLFFSSERLTIQMDNEQTIRDNRTLTHNPFSNQPGKPKYTLCSNQPRTVRIWSMTIIFFFFFAHSSPITAHLHDFNSGPARERQICSPNQLFKMLGF